MSRRGNGPGVLGAVVLACALLLLAGSCSSSSKSAGADQPPTTLRGTPSLTVPGLVAPPRSRKVVFTGEAADVEKAFRNLIAAFARKEVAVVQAMQTKPDPRGKLESFMNSYRVRLFRINDISVNGNDATVEYENSIVGRNVAPNATTTLLGQRDIWKRVDGRWKLVSDTAFTPGIPSDVRSVTVTMRDNAPIAVPAPLPKGEFAFLLKNTGRATKGMFILRVPRNLPLSTVVSVVGAVGTSRDSSRGTVFPDGITEMGATADVAGNRTGTMVFSGPLAKGRYVLLSRAANSGELLPNEVADFTVG